MSNRQTRSTTYRISKSYYGGFDLSLTASGIVILAADGTVVARNVIKTKLDGPARLDAIHTAIRNIIKKYEIE
jgi:hypothetical protein